MHPSTGVVRVWVSFLPGPAVCFLAFMLTCAQRTDDVIRYDDATSLRAKAGLAGKLGLAGAAFWSVEGMFNAPTSDAADVWSSISEALAT